MTGDEGVTPDAERKWTEPLVLTVRHLTRYEYHGRVWDSFNEARLQPASDSSQLCSRFLLRIDPAAEVREYPDFYGNTVHYFDLKPAHERLAVEALSTVETQPDARGALPASTPFAALKTSAVVEEYFDFLHDSHFVSLEADIWREAVDALPQGAQDLWLDTRTIGHHVYSTFTYTPRVTTVNTKPAEVVRTRRGVCQDFAHVMLGMCRTVGIPARYVSGYFFNPNRAPDEIEASHAWVEVFLPGFGWKGFDPTHNREPDTRYVKVAVGRDYGDIRPLGGTFRGAATREMSVEVQIMRQNAAGPDLG